MKIEITLGNKHVLLLIMIISAVFSTGVVMSRLGTTGYATLGHTYDEIEHGEFMIDNEGSAGQVWKSDGDGRGVWGTDLQGAGGGAWKIGYIDSDTGIDVSSGDKVNIKGGTFITTSRSTRDITVSHYDTSSQASVDNSGPTFIQDVTLDTVGHITGLTSAAETDPQVGATTNAKWCVGTGTQVACTADPPTGGTGDITGVEAGTGLSGGGSTGDVIINADTAYLQRRVSGSCASGAVSQINQDGTVSCYAAASQPPSVYKVSYIIRPAGSICPSGYLKLDLNGKVKHWDCNSGLVKFDGCAAQQNTNAQYEVLCISTTTKLNFIIIGTDSSETLTNCPDGWTEYIAPHWTKLADTYYSYWDCATGLTEESGCIAKKTSTSVTADPPTEHKRFGKMCIANGDSAVSYFILGRGNACPGGWQGVDAGDDMFWDCETDLVRKFGCMERNADGELANYKYYYGRLCIRQ